MRTVLVIPTVCSRPQSMREILTVSREAKRVGILRTDFELLALLVCESFVCLDLADKRDEDETREELSACSVPVHYAQPGYSGYQKRSNLD